MSSVGYHAKKAALGTAKGVGKVFSSPIGSFAWRATKAMRYVVGASLLAIGFPTLLIFPPLGVLILGMAATTYLLPAIGKRIGSIAGKLWKKTPLMGQESHGYTKALGENNPPQKPLGQQGQNQAFNNKQSGNFNDASADRRWRESFDDHRDSLDRQGLELHEQLNKASHERLGTMNPFNNGGRL